MTWSDGGALANCGIGKVKGTDLRGADLREAYFFEAKLDRVDLCGADFPWGAAF